MVYWLDEFNWAGDAEYDAEVEWSPVEIDNVIIKCKKDPSTKARKVVRSTARVASSRTSLWCPDRRDVIASAR